MSDFEQWWKREHNMPIELVLVKDREGNYVADQIHNDYVVWKAAKQSMQREAVGYASKESIKTARNGGDAIFGRMIPEVTRTVPLYTHAPDSAARIAEQDAEIAMLKAEIETLYTTMMAAAVEIQEHWDAHCDAEGYGPANLMHRLESGIASRYGYDAKTVVAMEAEIARLQKELEEARKDVKRIETINRECMTVDTFDMSDDSYGWVIKQWHMGKKEPVIIYKSYSEDVRIAIDAAIRQIGADASLNIKGGAV